MSEVMGCLKGKSSLMNFDRYANLKYKHGNRHSWCRGYYVETVGRNEKAIQEYVRNQLQEDVAADQIRLKEFTTRSRVSQQARVNKELPPVGGSP